MPGEEANGALPAQRSFEEEKMTPDYDLSNLQSCLANLWIYLQVDVIRAQILVEQAARHESTARHRLQHCSPYCEAAKDTAEIVWVNGYADPVGRLN
jgi:hypothetical protein